MQMRVVRILRDSVSKCNSFSTRPSERRTGRRFGCASPSATIAGAVDISSGGTMRTRLAALSIAVFAAITGASVSTQAQTTASAAPAAIPYDVPRTSWGDPNLQGVWDYRTITPMERRPELGDRAFYTEEEVAQLEGRAARRMDKPPDENTPVGLVHAEYLTDPGRFVDESYRTSLIIDPANG